MSTTTKPRIYIDSCCFIDMVKKTAGVLPSDREDDVWFLKKLLQANQDGVISVFTSLVTVGECVSTEKGQTVVPTEDQDAFKRLLMSGQYVRLLSPTPNSAMLMQQFRWTHNLVLGSIDAMHYAAAIEQKCNEFITTDDRLKKAKTAAAVPVLGAMGLGVVRAADTACLPNEYNQGALTGA